MEVIIKMKEREETVYLGSNIDIEKVKKEYLRRWAKVKLTSERACLITKAYKETEGEPILLRRAKAFKKILSEMSIYIQPWDLIVGNLGPEPVSIPVYPEGAIDFVLDQLDSFETRQGDKLEVSEDVKRELREVLPRWRGKTLKEYSLAITPKEVKESCDAGLFTYENMLTGGIGHFVPSYEKVLNWGIKGIEENLKNKVSLLDLSDPNDFQKHLFYQACLIVCEGVKIYAKRYANLAKELAKKEDDILRKNELLQISEICEHVPLKPARNFREALQTVWFTHVLCLVEENGYSITLGRMDQYLFPYYKSDIERKNLTKKEAERLLVSFWLKCSDYVKLYSNDASNVYAGFPSAQAPQLGGLTPYGDDATNELSELMLKVEEKVSLPQPDLAVLWTEKMSDDFLIKAAKLVVKKDKPKFYNTNIGIRILANQGVPLEEARKDWVFVGCVENSVAGKTWGWHNAGYYNITKCLELALNNGIDPRTKKQLGPPTGNPTNFKVFSEVVDAFKLQAASAIKGLVEGVHAVELSHREVWPEIWPSILVDDCIEKGIELNHGGARYNFSGIQAAGLATTVDSLMAIKKFVFDEKEIAFPKLLSVLESNFTEDEMLRQKLLNDTLKYGNDKEEADQLACEMLDFLCNEVGKYRNLRGGRFNAGFYTNAVNTYFGKFVTATTNGRKDGEPLSDATSPAHGADKEGPTAVLRSAAKLPHTKAGNGTLLNMKFNIQTLSSEERIKNFAKIIKAYFQLGGFHVQFNIIDPKVLLDAQKYPEKYPDLMVRVAAYVALWRQLSKQTQDEIIKRTLYTTLQ